MKHTPRMVCVAESIDPGEDFIPRRDYLRRTLKLLFFLKS